MTFLAPRWMFPTGVLYGVRRPVPDATMKQGSGISLTAHYTAQVWVRNGLPWARRFDTSTGRWMHRGAALFSALAARLGYDTPADFLTQRHRAIDKMVDDKDPDQFVELAGGLGPRCLARAAKTGKRCIDTDLAAVVQTKRRLIGDAAPPGYHLIALDLLQRDNYATALGSAFLAKPNTVVVTEGFLVYLPLTAQQLICNRVASLLRACGGGSYITDMHHGEEVPPLGQLYRAAMHVLARTPWHPLVANQQQAEDMLQQAGFSRVRVHDPRHIPGRTPPPRRRSVGLRIYEATL